MTNQRISIFNLSQRLLTDGVAATAADKVRAVLAAPQRRPVARGAAAHVVHGAPVHGVAPRRERPPGANKCKVHRVYQSINSCNQKLTSLLTMQSYK